jgi:hypothetical protein
VWAEAECRDSNPYRYFHLLNQHITMDSGEHAMLLDTGSQHTSYRFAIARVCVVFL